ncbi:MAG: helix-turn-helix domain-containing protein, partial [Brachymonas sp.]
PASVEHEPDCIGDDLLRALHAGMRRMGLESPAQHWLERATVPIDAKQQLVGQVIQARGVSALLQLGQGVHEQGQYDSLMPLLMHPGQPLRLLQVWLRLERYIHSKHRITQQILTPQSVLHQHISIKPDSAPSSAEDLVVLSVLIALLENVGCKKVHAVLGYDLAVWPWQDAPYQQAALKKAFLTRQTFEWQLSWEKLADQSVDDHSAPLLRNPAESDGLTSRLQQWATQTLSEALSIEVAAQTMCMSTRSLQRKLNQEGVRYVDIIATARAERASKLLCESKASLAEVGFASGYTDQAHFCRDFKRRVGMTPLRYREYSLS